MCIGKQLAHCDRCGDEKPKLAMAFICGHDRDYWECDSCADRREQEAAGELSIVCKVCDADVALMDTANGICNSCEDRIQRKVSIISCM